MSEKYLIIPTGIAGSGKTYFAEGLAEKLPAIWIGSDGVRLSMFGKDAPRTAMTEEHHKLVFAALHYFTRRALAYGANVIYDAGNSLKWVRDDLCELAKECGATPIIVLIKTPTELALQRAINRPASDNTWPVDPEGHKLNVAKFEPPEETPDLIIIDGQKPIKEQLSSFEEQFQKRGAL